MNHVVFILSHGRPNEQKTLKALKDSGYSGDWYIICDDTDKTLDEYKQKYGERIIVFNKREEAERTDTFDNFEILSTPLYARNASRRIAKDLGYSHYIMMDDDISGFKHRYEHNGSLKTGNVQDIGQVFQLFEEFMESLPHTTVLSFGHGGHYAGGLDGLFRDGLSHTPYHVFMCRVEDDIQFVGTYNEDYILKNRVSRDGGLMYAVLDVQLIANEKRGSNDGGLSSSYKNMGWYPVAFYGVIDSPDSIKIRVSDKGENYHISQRTNHRVPKVLSEKWRSVDE